MESRNYNLTHKEIEILRYALGALGGLYEVDDVTRQKLLEDEINGEDIEKLNERLKQP